MKRILDVVFAAIGLAALSPLYLIIYIGQRLSCRGPVFFKQERIGLGGRPFQIYKFRTMVENGEAGGVPQLAEVVE